MKIEQCRTREQLIEAIALNSDQARPKYVFFWGHTPRSPGIVDRSCFSQWFPADFEIEGITYRTAEHYMMAEKARLFKDSEIVEQILETKEPAAVKKLGRKVSNYDDKAWREHRFEAVVRGNVAKFSQHNELRKFLQNTHSRVLVEASPRDQIWGIGMGASNPNAENPANWRGRNLLGFALMETRERICHD